MVSHDRRRPTTSSKDRETETEKTGRAGDHGKREESEVPLAFFHLPRDLRALTILFTSPPIYLLLSLALQPAPLEKSQGTSAEERRPTTICDGCNTFFRIIYKDFLLNKTENQLQNVITPERCTIACLVVNN